MVISLGSRSSALEIEQAQEATAVEQARRRRLPAFSDRTLVFGSLAVVGMGFAVLAFTWGQVAGEALVARQLPYIVSGGLTGLALVVVGTALCVVGAWRAERQADQWELERICALVREVADSVRTGR